MQTNWFHVSVVGFCALVCFNEIKDLNAWQGRTFFFFFVVLLQMRSNMWAQTLLSGIWELQNSFARSIRHVQHPLLLYSIYPILYPNVGRGQSVTEKVANVDKDNKNKKLLMMTCGSQKYVYRGTPVILKAQLNHWMLPKDGLGWILFKFWSSLTNLPCKHSSTIQNEPCFPCLFSWVVTVTLKISRAYTVMSKSLLFLKA